MKIIIIIKQIPISIKYLWHSNNGFIKNITSYYPLINNWLTFLLNTWSVLRGFRMCRSSVLQNNYFCVFLIAKIARMNCFSDLFSFQTCTDRDGYGVADTIFCRCKESILQKTLTKSSRTYLRTMRFNSRVRLFLCYWHVWGNRENARTAKGQAALFFSICLCSSHCHCVYF